MKSLLLSTILLASPTWGFACEYHYFESLLARPDLWKAYSLRPRPGEPKTSPYYEKQLMSRRNGGYAQSNYRPLAIIYDPAHDTDPMAQDAAKAVVPADVNSLQNQVRLPLGTSDGNTYFFTWDSYWTDSYRHPRGGIDTYKAFQFETARSIWFEARLRFNGGSGKMRPPGFDSAIHVAAIDFRGYNHVDDAEDWSLTDGNSFGPRVTDSTPISPMAGTLAIKPNQWVRHFVLIEQRAGDYDYVDAWVATEDTDAVLLLDNLPISVRSEGHEPLDTISEFYLELNTSKATLISREVGLDLVSYHRNFVALKNPDESRINDLLVRPIGDYSPNYSALSISPSPVPELVPCPEVKPCNCPEIRIDMGQVQGQDYLMPSATSFYYPNEFNLSPMPKVIHQQPEGN